MSAALIDLDLLRGLESIDEPADLRRLPVDRLPLVAAQLRSELIRSVAASGGHLASGLGAIELTLALHYVFDTPADTLVWDIGHQAYPHRMLTGRRQQLRTVRRRGGPSGFLRREDSAFDAFGAGHCSTSISAALGMAAAKDRLGVDSRTIAVIGDGALSAGLAFEALDHAGSLGLDLLVVVNDNAMSISPNVGALSAGDAARKRRFFDDLGFSTMGSVDGHDVGRLVSELQTLRSQRGPRMLHVVTRKGEGYAPAQADPVRYHGVSPFDPSLGLRETASACTFTQVFGDWLLDAGDRDPRVVGITPAMIEGSGLARFQKAHPSRCFDVGIAEQHSVTFAAGLACQGMKPVVALYSTFLQRAYDQVLHDVALQRLPVLFAVDRAGLVGPDGATHNGSFDLSFLRCIPGLVVMTPSDGSELSCMLTFGLAQPGPTVVRYPRAVIPEAAKAKDCGAADLALGRSRCVRHGASGIALLVFGPLLQAAMLAAETLDATVIDMRFVKPLDEGCVIELARAGATLVTIEDNAIAGGAGSAVAECLAAHGVPTDVLHLGLPDRFAEHGTRDEVLRDAGLDANGIVAAVTRRSPDR